MEYENDNRVRNLGAIIAYKDFITHPLTLSQFIPCDKEGKPMTTNNHFPNREMAEQYEREFQQAVDAVIFEGWVIVDSPYGENIIVLQNTPRRIRITNGKFAFKTIESFINNGGKLKLKQDEKGILE